MLIAQSCPTLCNPMDCSLPGCSVHGLLQARILEWVAFPSPEDLSDPGIEPRSPALQADTLPSEPPRSEVDCQGNSPIVFLDVDTSPNRTCQVAQWVKNLPAMQIQSLGWEDPLEQSMATHSSILAWRIPSTEEPEGLQSIGLQKVRHD